MKRILADNFVRPDDVQKILSKLRKNGSHTFIDMITVKLDVNKNRFFAEFSNLGLGGVPIEDEYSEKHDQHFGNADIGSLVFHCRRPSGAEFYGCTQ